jgi:hypothetical protein
MNQGLEIAEICGTPPRRVSAGCGSFDSAAPLPKSHTDYVRRLVPSAPRWLISGQRMRRWVVRMKMCTRSQTPSRYEAQTARDFCRLIATVL